MRVDALLDLTWLNSLLLTFHRSRRRPGNHVLLDEQKQNERRNHSQCEIAERLPGALPFWYGSRATNDQRRFEDDSFSCCFTANAAQQQVGGFLTHRIGWLRDNCQGGICELGPARIVKTNERKVTRDLELLLLPNRQEGPGHHFVIRHEDGRWRTSKGEKSFRSVLPGSLTKIAEFDVLVRNRYPGCPECFAKPFQSAASVGKMLWTRDDGDPSMTEPNQMTSGNRSAEMIVEYHRIDILEPGTAIQIDQWD